MKLRYWRDTHGGAAVELAIMLPLLTIPMMSVVDIGVYTYDKIQVENAAQSAAQALWATCTVASNWPFSTYCTQIPDGTSVQSVVINAAHQTSLGTAVTVTGIGDYYYCTAQNSSNALTLLQPSSGKTSGGFGSPIGSSTSGGSSAAPSSCGSAPSGYSWAGGGTLGEYAGVFVSFTYTPMFGGISVASLLPATITKTAFIRMD